MRSQRRQFLFMSLLELKRIVDEFDSKFENLWNRNKKLFFEKKF